MHHSDLDLDRAAVSNELRPASQKKGEQKMADDLSKRGPRDRDRVNVHEDWEANYWSKKFGVSKQQLQEAVQKVGVMAKDVEKYLKK